MDLVKKKLFSLLKFSLGLFGKFDVRDMYIKGVNWFVIAVENIKEIFDNKLLKK
jgi:hypothetical protein